MLAFDSSRSSPVEASVLNGVAEPELPQSISSSAACALGQLLLPPPSPLLPLQLQLLLPLPPLLPLHMQLLLPPPSLPLPLPLQLQLLLPLLPLLPLHMQLLLPPSPPVLPLQLQLLLPLPPLLPLQLLPLLPMAPFASVTAVKSGGAVPNGLTKPMPSTDPPTENMLTSRAPVVTT